MQIAQNQSLSDVGCDPTMTRVTSRVDENCRSKAWHPLASASICVHVTCALDTTFCLIT